MHIHDDADSDMITKEAVGALRECARMIGKIGPTFNAVQLEEIAAAVQQVQATLDVKRRMARG